MKLFLIVSLMLLLSACQNQPYTPPSPTKPTPIEPVTPNEETPSDKTTYPPIEPEVQPSTIDWSVSLHTITDSLAKAKIINANDLLFVNKIKNRSRVDINIDTLTNELITLLQINHHFNIVKGKALMQAKQRLGMENDDSLNTRSKTIALANSLEAPYILYTTIEQADDKLLLLSQAMQVNTGEIIWQEELATQHQEN